MATIEVNIVATDNLASKTAQAAAGMSLLAKKETELKGLAKELGNEQQNVKKAILGQEDAAKRVAKEERAAAAEAKKFANEKAKAEKAAENAKIRTLKASRLELATEKAFKKENKDVADIMRGDITPLLEGFGPKAGAAVAFVSAMGTAFLVAGAAAVGLLGAVASLAYDAGKAKENVKGVLDVLTGGHGAETLTMLDGLAQKLGMTIGDTRDQFIKFREAGLSNAQSTSLIKLRADLLATGMSAGKAEEGIKKIIDQAKKADGSIDPKTFSAAFEKIASEANVAGNGFLAAQKNAKSFEGALNRLDNSKTIALEQIFERIKPSLDEAATKVASFVEAFMKSEEGKKALEGIGNAITTLVKLGADAAIFLAENWKGVAIAFGVVAAGALVLAAVFAPIPVAILAIVGAVTYIISKFTEFDNALGYLSDEARSWGQNIVNGISEGIKNAAGALLQGVKDLAGNISSTFKGVLGIHSPAKDGIFIGKMEGKGAEIGLDRAKSGVEASAKDLGETVSDGVSSGASGGSPSVGGGGGSSSSSGGDFNLTIQSLSFGGQNPEDDFAKFRRMLDDWYTSKTASRGVA